MQQTQQKFTEVNMYGIPYELTSLDQWALYSTQKFPVKAFAVYQGWPVTKMDEAGAGSTRPDTWASYEDVKTAYWRKSSEVVHGPSFALTPENGFVVFDLDKPKRPQRPDESADDYAVYVNSVNKINADILGYFPDTFAEESMSGNGYHLFVRGRLPEGVSRYAMITGGHIFADKQFIHMTGATLPDRPMRVVEDQVRLDAILKGLLDANLIKVLDPKDDPKSDTNIALLHEKSTQLGRRLDLTDAQVVETLMKRGQKIVETYTGHGEGFTGDWSEGTQILIGEIDKITGDAEQVERVLFGSPRLRNAGTDARGVDRFEKIQRVFRDNFIKARLSNDKTLQNKPINDPLMQQNMAVILAGPGSKQYADTTAQRVAERVAAANAPVADGAGRFSRDAVRVAREIMGDLPEEYMLDKLPPGIGGEMCMYAFEAMYEPLQEFAIASTLAFLAGTNARRCKLPDGQGPVLNFIIAAATGVGKNQALDAWKNLAANVISGTAPAHGQPGINGLRVRPRHKSLMVASRAGLTGVLMDQGCFLDCVDECEPMLKVLATSQGDKAEMLMQSFRLQTFDLSKAHEGFNADASVEAQKRGDKTVFNVSVSALWATTLDKAARYIDADFLGAGFGSRMLFILYKGKSGKNQKLKDVRRMLPREGSVRRHVELMMQLADEVDNFYEEHQISAPNVLPAEYWQKITQIAYGPGVQDATEALLDRMNAYKRAERDEELPGHYSAFNRVGMLTPRIAGLLAVADNPTNPVMTMEHFHWALGYVLLRTCTLVSAFDKSEMGVTLGDAHQAAVNLIKRMIAEPKWKALGFIEWFELSKRLKRIAPFHTNAKVNEYSRDTLIELMRMGVIRIDEIKNDNSSRNGRRVLLEDHPAWD